MTDQANAEAIANGLRSASFFEVEKIVDALNDARAGSRKAISGRDLMNAADFILNPSKPRPAPAPEAPEKAPKK